MTGRMLAQCTPEGQRNPMHSTRGQWSVHGANLAAAAAVMTLTTVAGQIDPTPASRALYAAVTLAVAARALWWASSAVTIDGRRLSATAGGRTRTVDLSRIASVSVRPAGRIAVTLTDHDGHVVTIRLGLLWDDEQTLARALRTIAVAPVETAGMNLLDPWTHPRGH